MKKRAYTTKHKVLAGVAAVGLATALAVPFVAYGADAPALGWGNAGSRACGASCADADGNGVCDSFADANGDGVCDNRGVHAACSAFSRGFAAFGECGRALGANFVDEDGDGLCDRREAGLGFGNGQGLGSGNGNAYGAATAGQGNQGAWCASCGLGFVDENGDGVCDHAGTGNANCSGFVDEGGNGTCDNAGSCVGNGQGAGQGAGYGHGHGSGNGGGHHGMCTR